MTTSNECSSNFQTLLQQIHDIVQPNGKVSESLEEGSDLDKILKSKLPNLSPDQDLHWNFTLHTLDLLQLLKSSLVLKEVEDKSQGYMALSIKEQKSVSMLIQISVTLGLLPNLMPGVGLSVEKRSKFAQKLLSQGAKTEVAIDQKYDRLCHVVNSLLALLESKSLNGLVISKNLGDLLSALLQLGYANLKKPTTNSEKEPQKGEFQMTQEKYDKFMEDQAQYKAQLRDKILDRVFKPLLVKHLLVIQTPSSSTSKVPKWLQSACGNLLSEILSQENGVLNVMRGVMDIGGVAEDGKPKTEKFEIIAKVLASPPQNSSYKSLETYYQLICPQLLRILSVEDSSEAKEYHLIACACIRSVSERSLILSRRYLFDPILASFYPLTILNSKGSEEKEEAKPFQRDLSEEAFESNLNLIHLIFVVGNPPSCTFMAHMDPIVPFLFELHCSITFGVSHLKTTVGELLQRYLKCMGQTDSIAALKTFAFRNHNSDNDSIRFRLPKVGLKFRAGEKGGVVPEIHTNEVEENFYVADDERAIAIVDMLQDSKDKTLAVDFFMSLLADLSMAMATEEDNDNLAKETNDEDFSLEEKLLAFEKELDETMAKLRSNLMLIRILGLMSEEENLQKSIIKNSEQLLRFVQLTLNRGALGCSNKKLAKQREIEMDSTGLMLQTQSLNMALTLLSFKLVQEDVQIEEWEMLQKSAEDLRILELHYPEDQIKKMARRLRQLIVTHGAILDHNGDIKKKCETISSKTDQIREMTNKLKEMAVNAEIRNNNDEKDVKPSSYEMCLKELTDPLLPVRGHAIISLNRLIEENDEVTIRNVKKVINIFQENLEDEDTYIYLAAINGLVTSANFDPDLIIDLLTREFSILDDRKFPEEKSFEVRTKIGEALVRITRNLSNLTPKFKNQLLNPFLSQLNHPDALIRASCLSNLGEICKNLRFSLGSIVEEIFMQLNHCIDCDSNLEVRRAAVMVIGMLIQGLGKESLKVLGPIMKDIWRTLMKLSRSEEDPALLFHVNSAIEEINKIVKLLFQPSNELKKNIYVLDAPPDN